ncbi:MAG: DUF5667 domain-containing protein [Patescibacteria group bacterium]
MTDKNLIQLLEQIKDAPEFGGGFDAQHEDRCWSKICDELGFEKSTQNKTYALKDYSDYIFHSFSAVVMRPVALAASVLLVVFGGWVTTVSASFNTVPGDTLYPVKMVTERVQLSLATTTQRRAKLHVEFAGRRLNEMTKLQEQGQNGKKVNQVVASFKSEMALANETLTQLNEHNTQMATEIAVVLDQKSDEYAAVLDGANNESNRDVQELLSDAHQAAKDSESHAVNTLVAGGEANSEEIQHSFQTEMKSIKDRATLSLGRIGVIEDVIELLDNRGDFVETVVLAKSLVRKNDTIFNQAMDSLAAGGSTKAFELLGEADDNISQAEEMIIELEVEITILSN